MEQEDLLMTSVLLMIIMNSSNLLRTYTPNELELKVENLGTYATFLDLDIAIKDNIFIYKLFDKRDEFPFFIVRMLHLSSNILSSLCYGSFYSELLRISRCTSLFSDFTRRPSELYNRMVLQEPSRHLPVQS